MVITVSRQSEAGAEEIVRLVSEKVGLQIADRTILRRIAEREGIPLSELDVFDDKHPSALEAVIAEWRSSVSHGAYRKQLVQALLALEREGNVIIVGRGAAFVLTDPGTLHVRIIAPMPCRIARLLQRQHIYPSEAQRKLLESDKVRARFVRESFNSEISDPYHYDLTINTAELKPEEAVDTIIRAAQMKSTRREVGIIKEHDLLMNLTHLQRKPRLPRVSEVVWRYTEKRRRIVP